MSCRDCGCFTLFKDICESCERATFIFDELAVVSHKTPEVTTDISDHTPNVGQKIVSSHQVYADSDDASVLEAMNQLPDQSPAPENVTAVAAKLGINLGDLQDVFDINELSLDIANAVTADRLALVSCRSCDQMIKQKSKCPYCGHANNNN